MAQKDVSIGKATTSMKSCQEERQTNEFRQLKKITKRDILSNTQAFMTGEKSVKQHMVHPRSFNNISQDEIAFYKSFNNKANFLKPFFTVVDGKSANHR